MSTCASTPDTSNLLMRQQMLGAKALGVVVHRLFPQVILAGGGTNSLGFYYDFIFEAAPTESILELIEVEFFRFIKGQHPIRYIDMMRENAESFFTHHGHFLLAEKARKERSNIIPLVQMGDFFDLCPPLALDDTLEIGHVKLFGSQEAVFETETEQIPVTRLVGTSRATSKDLKTFVKMYASFLKKSDHRMVGPTLNLFSFYEGESGEEVFWHPKGMQLRAILWDLLKQHSPHDEWQISTPLVATSDCLMRGSSSTEPVIFEEKELHLRSSFLPAHLSFLSSSAMRDEDMPRRVTEYGQLFCSVPESSIWGLYCRHSFFADQTTICCSKEQVLSELISSLLFIEQIITIFPFEAQWYFIASGQKTAKAREREALLWLKEALQARKNVFSSAEQIVEEEEGEGLRLELRIKDALGREWPVSKIGIPQWDGKKLFPSIAGIEKGASAIMDKSVIVTRSIMGSIDRFVALLIELYQGVFPLGIAPEQMRILVIGKSNEGYAKQVLLRLRSSGLRVKLDARQEKLDKRIHQAEKENIPFLILIGEQERMKQVISVRSSKRFRNNHSVDVETFLNEVRRE